MSMNILVTSKSFGKIDSKALRMLEEHGFSITFLNSEKMTSKLIAENIKDIDCLIVGNDPVGFEVFESANKLKLIHMHGTGLDGIDIELASKHKVLVANVIGANKNAVAEMTLALMLTVGRRIDTHIQWLREGFWKRKPGNEVSYKTVGIIGLGNIGKRLVELLLGFNVHVVGYDPVKDISWAASHDVYLASCTDEVFACSDFLVLSLPYTKETEHIVCERTLSLMKPTAYLINTARGGLVDEEALAEAIQTGVIAGAAIDTFKFEPPDRKSNILAADIVATPHISATSIETSSYVSMIVSQQIVDILCHGKSTLAVNWESL